MKNKIFTSLKKYSKNFVILLVVYILAKIIAHSAYKADIVPLALLGQLLVFSSYIYCIILIFKFVSSINQSTPKPDATGLNNEISNQITQNNQDSVGNTVTSIGSVFSFVVLAFVLLIVLVFMAIGLGSK